MKLNIGREHYGKLILVGATILMWLSLLTLFKTYGYYKTWNLWKVPTFNITFLDFRLIPGSAESFRHGYEPSAANPYDPTKRIFNYPAFWRLFFYTGITEADTVWISIGMIVLFFIGVLLFPKDLSVAGAIGMLLVIFSPAAMLLYERGNVDLVVFFICAMIVIAESYSANLAALLIAVGAIVKMFPFFGITVLFKEAKNKFWLLFGICFAVFVTYMILTWSSVKASWNTTMRGDGLSYGTNVLVTRYWASISKVLEQWFTPHHSDLILKNGPLLLALFLLLLFAVLSLLNTEQLDSSSERHLAAFRMGASVYVGTFLLGNNFDYRLAFLIFVVPQLIDWIPLKNKTHHMVAWISLLLVLLSCWHMWIIQIPLQAVFHSVEGSRKFWIILDETFNWMLFVSLDYLLLASAPQWLKQPFRSVLQKRLSVSSTSS